jgi:hypothetical protein
MNRTLSAEEAEVLYAREFRRCVLEIDVDGIIRLTREIAPHCQPSNPSEARASLHMARAQLPIAPVHLRIYSDRWLRERGLGSLMPHNLRPKGWKARG